MSPDMFKIGNKVEIVRSSAVHNGIVDDKKNPVLVSQIYEITDSDHLQLEMPLRGTEMVLLDIGIRYDICIYTSHGLFKCMVQVTDRFKTENRYIALVEVKSAFKRVQRREYFRLEKLFEVKYRRLMDYETDKNSTEEILSSEEIGTEYRAAVAVDLSGGGARLIMNERFTVKDTLMLRFKIAPESDDINFAATIVSSNPMKMDKTQYENRVKFVKLRESQREKLIRYIFEEERKMRFKEKS